MDGGVHIKCFLVCSWYSHFFLNEAHKYALHLVRSFMPSYKVEKYQFRGMRPKEHTLSIGFADLSLELYSGEKVLKGVTGEFQESKIVQNASRPRRPILWIRVLVSVGSCF